MFSKEKEIEFTKHFTSPVLGNVYPTKRKKLPAKEADKFIAAGVAVEVNAPKSDPYAGMTPAQKKKAVAEAAKAAEADKAKATAIAEKQARLDELAGKDGLTEAEAAEADALEIELEALNA